MGFKEFVIINVISVISGKFLLVNLSVEKSLEFPLKYGEKQISQISSKRVLDGFGGNVQLNEP